MLSAITYGCCSDICMIHQLHSAQRNVVRIILRISKEKKEIITLIYIKTRRDDIQCKENKMAVNRTVSLTRKQQVWGRQAIIAAVCGTVNWTKLSLDKSLKDDWLCTLISISGKISADYNVKWIVVVYYKMVISNNIS